MQHRPISGTQRAQRRRRRQQQRIVDCAVCLAIAGHRPRSALPCTIRKLSSPACTIAPSGNCATRHRQRMQPLLAALQPLAMQHGVDLARANVRNAIALLPRRAKPVGVVAAAEEARAMAGRERGRLVEKEQLGPAPPAHHLAPPAPEFADAGDPRRARPALLQQGLGRGIVDDAAIAGEQAAMRGGDDVAGGRDAVLQGHG